MKHFRTVVGVDPSIANTGVVVLDAEDGRLLAAIDGRQGLAGEKSKDPIVRYMAQADYIAKHLDKYQVCKIAYENYSFGSVHRAYSLAEFGGILKARLYGIVKSGIVLVSPMQNKKFACGDYMASKEKMRINALSECSDLGLKPSFDVCDAYFLALFAWYMLNPEMAVKRGSKLLRLRLEMTNKNGEK